MPVSLLAIAVVMGASPGNAQTQSMARPWSGHGHDPQHTGVSSVASQPLQQIKWQTPVDLAPQYVGTTLYAHYGSPVVTRQNTVIVPVKTGAIDGFRVEAHDGVTGTLKWMQTTDYSLPGHNWVPHFSLAITPRNRLYFAGAGGTIRYRDSPDAASPPSGSEGQLAFYGMENYSPASFDSAVKICTAITSDRYGNIYFGFLVNGTVTLPGNVQLQSGMARIAEDGTGSWVAAGVLAADASISRPVYNQAPALSNDQRILYVGVRDGSGFGYLVALDSRTLATINKVRLKDALNPSADGWLFDDGTASPTVGPDGDVYFGVLGNSIGANHFRGWLCHYDKLLGQTKTPGGFGWDHTPSIVDASLVPGYAGTSEYLLLCKYNNYAGAGGDGVNRMAILDPNDTMTDPYSPATVMKEVITIAGPTPDNEYPSFPNAVREWCVNTVAIDPFTRSAIVPCEDGKVYRWSFTTNSLSESLQFPRAIGEAYTPTLIGVDGTVFAISNAILFAIGGAAP